MSDRGGLYRTDHQGKLRLMLPFQFPEAPADFFLQTTDQQLNEMGN